MFTQPAKKKLRLDLKLFQEQIDCRRESISTPNNELDCSRAKQAFTKPSTQKQFIDQKGNIGIEYSNQYLLKLQEPLTPGSHAKVQKEQLVSPGKSSSISLVRKYGASTIQAEIKINQFIASHPKSVQKAILQPLFIENHLNKCILHFPLMPGGNLKKQQVYLFNTLNNFNTKNVATQWLYKQIVSLFEALKHLHTEEFSTGNMQYKGIVHGDIKPDNILINGSGDLMLADFGCAYSAIQPAKQLGSICYSAPEIFANDNFTKKSIKAIEKSDIWSLGIVLHSLLMNKFPYSSSEFAERKAKLTESIYFNSMYVANSKNRFNKIQGVFFEDSIEGCLYRKKWGENYQYSNLAKQARKALARLKNNNYQILDSNQPIALILKDISLSCFLPAEERLSASETLEQLKKLAPYFNCFSTHDEYNMFITDLLAQPALNSVISHGFPSPSL